jgi:predicted NBD/HSP70 family sugar kinase
MTSAGDRRAERSLPRPQLLRQLSDRAIFDAIITSGASTRAELATVTGISKPTVSQSIRRLEDAGLVVVSGTQSGRRGRVGTYYDIGVGAGIVVAVELDQAGIVVRTLDLAGRVLEDTAYPPTAVGDDRALASGLRDAIAVARQISGGKVDIRAAGISVANPVDPATGRVVTMPDSPFPEGIIQPVEILGDLVAGPVLVDNDVNLAALAERYDGAAVDADSFAYLYLGAGLGGAVCIGDDLIRGAHGLAGELGYLPAPGASVADETLAQRLARGSTGPASPPAVDVDQVTGLLDSPSGRKRAATISRLTSSAAHAAVALIASVDPALVLLGGPLGAHPALLEPFREHLAALWPQPVRVEVSTLGRGAALHGATQVALNAARRAGLDQVGPAR